jgi:hypothetical protein
LAECWAATMAEVSVATTADSTADNSDDWSAAWTVALTAVRRERWRAE